MNYELLLQHVKQHIELSGEEEEYFLGLFQPRALKARHFLYHEGDISKGQAFVTSGCLRSYAIDQNGFEHILQFAPAGWWIGDMHSLIHQQPGKLTIDAVENSEMLFVYKTDLGELFQRIPKFEHYFRVLLERSLITYQNRLLDNLSLTARERYENFCRHYPTLIQQLPQKQVASYIGVTPEFLSRMLSKPATVAKEQA
ncbi:MAG: Crp/Fnr family transcriptional regulator [Sphingobacteriales bacterium]|nr:MAG: Crp/Fnr family transcriptional regulator [Sphingobacteriales bacterium]